MTIQIELLADTLQHAGLILPPRAERIRETLQAIHTEQDIDPASGLTSTGLTPANAGKRTRDLALALASRSHIGEATNVYSRLLSDDFRAAIRESAGELIEQAKPAFAQAASVLQRAGELLQPGATREQAWAAGTEALDIFEQLPTAVQMLTLIRSARVELGAMLGDPEMRVAWFIAEARGKDALVQAHMLYGHRDQYIWHRLTAAGFVLKLNNPDEARLVEERAANWDLHAAEEADERRRAANHDPMRERYFADVLSGQEN